MEFRLVYQGALPAAGKSTRAKEKHEIRRVLHKQIANLWKAHPFLAKYAERRQATKRTAFYPSFPPPEGQSWPVEIQVPSGPPWSTADNLSYKYRNCGYRFVPLVGSLFGEGAETVCALDILFLRRDSPGSVVSGGDIDNRLKVLFDALRMPQNCDEVKGFDPPDFSETPFFCLLEDDSLITDVRVTTDQLLTPLGEGEHIHDVNLIIRVRTMAVGMGFADIGMPPPVVEDGKLTI